MLKPFITLCLLLMTLTACASSVTPENAQLPTLAQLPVATGALPTQASTPTEPQSSQSNTPAAAAQQNRATLPPTWTQTQTPSQTPGDTATHTPAVSPTASVTPSATITETSTPTATPLPTIPPEDRPILGLFQAALNATILPTDYVVPAYQGIDVRLPPTPAPSVSGTVIPPIGGAPIATQPQITSTCTFLPPGGFGTLFANNPDVAAQIGCPAGSPPDVVQVNGAWQRFERGLMVWLSGTIYVLYGAGPFEEYTDTFDPNNDPDTLPGSAPPGTLLPVRGFGKVWANNANVQNNLGYAREPEIGLNATVQRFANGMMIYFPNRNDVLTLIGRGGGAWRSLTGRF